MNCCTKSKSRIGNLTRPGNAGSGNEIAERWYPGWRELGRGNEFHGVRETIRVMIRDSVRIGIGPPSTAGEGRGRQGKAGFVVTEQKWVGQAKFLAAKIRVNFLKALIKCFQGHVSSHYFSTHL